MSKQPAGILLRILGGIGIILAMVIAFSPKGDIPVDSVILLNIVLLLAVIGLFLGGKYMTRLGKRLSALPADQAMANDPRAPVLYLRSFKDETFTSQHIGEVGIGLWSKMGGIATREEDLTVVLEEIGPVIAIGKPGERLPQVGAARFYASDEDWQSLFLEQLARAQLVVLRAGSTPGLMWEFQQVFQHTVPAKIIILVPLLDHSTWTEFSDAVGASLPKDLPNLPKSLPKSSIGAGLLGYLSFNEAGQSEYHKFETPPQNFIRKRRMHPLVPTYKWSFRPVFESLQVPWDMPRILMTNILMMVVYAAGAIILVFSLGMFFITLLREIF